MGGATFREDGTLPGGLLAPVAAIGVATGVLCVQALGFSPWLAPVGGGAAALVAVAVAWVVGRQREATARAVLLFVIGFGLAFTLTVIGIGLALSSGNRLLNAVLVAMTAPVLAMPLIAPACIAHARIGRARRGSTLDRRDRRRVWWVAAGTSLVAALAVVPVRAVPAWTPLGVIAAALAVAAILLRIDRHEARRLSEALRTADRRIEATAFPDAPEHDVGVGDERWLCLAEHGLPYRSSVAPLLVVRGALLDAVDELRRATLLDATTLAAAFAGMLCVYAWPAPPPRAPAPAPPVVAAPAVEAPSNLTWYPEQQPIVVDLDGDGTEDVIGLRWDSGHPEAALTVAATSGATQRTLWQTDRIACQWASPHMQLAMGDNRLYLTDSEGLLHIYAVADGRPVREALKLPATSLCTAPGAPAQAWLHVGEDWTQPDKGVIVDADGAPRPAPRPAWCIAPWLRPDPDARVSPACSTKLAKALAIKRAVTLKRNGGVGVAFGATDEEAPSGSMIAGFDPETCAVLWKGALAFTSEPYHRAPHLSTELLGDRVFAFYQLADGRWYLGARDARTGAALWHREPPRAHFGTDFTRVTVTRQRIYLGVNWRLEIFDPEDGKSLGVIW